jgi:hypothetical protein
MQIILLMFPFAANNFTHMKHIKPFCVLDLFKLFNNWSNFVQKI